MASLGVLKRISGNTFDHDVVAFGALKRTRFKARDIRRDAREHRANAAACAYPTLYRCRFHDAALPQNIAGLEQASQPSGIVSGLLFPNALAAFAPIHAIGAATGRLIEQTPGRDLSSTAANQPPMTNSTVLRLCAAARSFCLQNVKKKG